MDAAFNYEYAVRARDAIGKSRPAAAPRVAAAKMTSTGPVQDGIVVIEPGAAINVAFLLTDDAVEKLKIQVLDAETDAVLYTSPADIPVRLGV